MWVRAGCNWVESIHLIRFLLDLVEKGGEVLELFCARDKEGGICEGFRCISAATEHSVDEGNAVIDPI